MCVIFDALRKDLCCNKKIGTLSNVSGEQSVCNSHCQNWFAFILALDLWDKNGFISLYYCCCNLWISVIFHNKMHAIYGV